jgi:hypothetical protein
VFVPCLDRKIWFTEFAVPNTVDVGKVFDYMGSMLYHLENVSHAMQHFCIPKYQVNMYNLNHTILFGIMIFCGGLRYTRQEMLLFSSENIENNICISIRNWEITVVILKRSLIHISIIIFGIWV